MGDEQLTQMHGTGSCWWMHDRSEVIRRMESMNEQITELREQVSDLRVQAGQLQVKNSFITLAIAASIQIVFQIGEYLKK